MILLINTTEHNKINLALKKGNRIFEEALNGDYKVSEKLLFVLDKLIKKNKLKLSDLKGIIVINGIGSFTALRIAVTVANTLGFIYNIPVTDYLPKKDQILDYKRIFDQKIKILAKIKKRHLIMPVYERSANITFSKTKP